MYKKICTNGNTNNGNTKIGNYKIKICITCSMTIPVNISISQQTALTHKELGLT